MRRGELNMEGGGRIMSKFFEDTMQGLLEAVAIDKGEIPLVEKSDMLATTFVADDIENKVIEDLKSNLELVKK